MTSKTVLEHLNLNTWKRGKERAPHKPLLVLWAIGRCMRGESRLVEYSIVHDELKSLLQRFGPHRRYVRPHFPFWRLQKDGVWEVRGAERVKENSSGDVSPKELREFNVFGGLTKDLFEWFRRDRSAALEVCLQLVEGHFTPTLLLPVLEATLGPQVLMSGGSSTGHNQINPDPMVESLRIRRYRDPGFRGVVLKAYEHGCAVCEYSIEFPAGNWPALEAAHIQWHSCRGPDDITNGLSLCLLHHELFDRGAFTIDSNTQDFRVVVAEPVLELVPLTHLNGFHEKPLARTPDHPSQRPALASLKWHNKYVFKGKL